MTSAVQDLLARAATALTLKYAGATHTLKRSHRFLQFLCLAQSCVEGDIQIAPQLSGAHAEFPQFFSQVLPRMYRRRWHGILPSFY